MMRLDRILASLAAHGFTVTSADYRFTGEARFPAQVQDAKASVRWLHANAAHWHVYPAHIGALGEFAGGYLVVMLGTTCGVATLEPPTTAGRSFPGMEIVHTDAKASDYVQSVVDYYGPADFTSMDVKAA